MKRKIFSIVIAFVLVTGLCLLPAAVLGQAASNYMGIKLGVKNDADATATWSTTETHSGNYAVHLVTGPAEGDGDEGRIEITMPAGTTLGDIETIAWWVSTKLGYSPHLDITIDCDGDGVVDDEDMLTAELAVNNPAYTHPPVPGADEWRQTFEMTTGDGYDAITDNTTFWVTKLGAGDQDAPSGQLWQWKAGIVASDPENELPTTVISATAPIVKLEIVDNWIVVSEAYIDDITINGTTYDLEPMVLNAAYYKTGASAGAVVFNGYATGTIAAYAYSDTVGIGHPITFSMTETSPDVFTGGFGLVGATPGPGQLLVNEGDTIYVKCIANWGAGSQEIDWGPTGTVDDTAPVITPISPTASANITEIMPLIKATYTDVGSAVDNATAVMTLNGSPVTPDTCTIATIEYTPSVSANLSDGTYTVTVDVDDLAGNAATQASWSFTVDTLAPAITGQAADPVVIMPSTETEVTFMATVTDATSGIDTVTIDLTDVGGGAAVAMLDGDADGVYAATENITESDEGNYELTVTATDMAGNSDTADIALGVWSDIIDPVITGPAIEYPFGLTSAMPGDDVTISATVTDDTGIGPTGTVTAACTAFTGDATLVDDGTGVDATADDDIYTGTATVADGTPWGDYTVTITATDAKGNDDTDTSLELRVRSGATGCDIDLVEGWNLVSLPLIPDSDNISVVISVDTLASDNVSNIGIIWAYDPVTEEFIYYMPGSGSGELATMEDGAGYWVFMQEDDTLTITGAQWPAPPAVPPTYDVVVGWNLIGFKSIANNIDYEAGSPDTGYLLNIAGTYPVLWSYDAAGGAYENVKGVPDGMVVGHGFWIWITAAGTIVPPN